MEQILANSRLSLSLKITDETRSLSPSHSKNCNFFVSRRWFQFLTRTETFRLFVEVSHGNWRLRWDASVWQLLATAEAERELEKSRLFVSEGIRRCFLRRSTDGESLLLGAQSEPYCRISAELRISRSPPISSSSCQTQLCIDIELRRRRFHLSS